MPVPWKRVIELQTIDTRLDTASARSGRPNKRLGLEAKERSESRPFVLVREHALTLFQRS